MIGWDGDRKRDSGTATNNHIAYVYRQLIQIHVSRLSHSPEEMVLERLRVLARVQADQIHDPIEINFDHDVLASSFGLSRRRIDTALAALERRGFIQKGYKRVVLYSADDDNSVSKDKYE